MAAFILGVPVRVAAFLIAFFGEFIMTQLTITLIIISAAAAAAGYRMFHFFRKPPSYCDGCDKSCGGCPLDDLKSQSCDRRTNRRKPEEFTQFPKIDLR
jgi:hypothetical protein